ncbi:MAG TPA: hypothetical protein VF557_09080 [Jatrophihabitans sp.]|jgi:hypothetical protein|uniref:hypothetical protein n=1 Tax=Jatrophihabitans sp. TaxID=1932789 RepID=UPI002EDE17F2
MSNYTNFCAAVEIAAAFGAVPTGLTVVSAVRDHDITGIEMTNVFGQARRPRKIPL